MKLHRPYYIRCMRRVYDRLWECVFRRGLRNEMLAPKVFALYDDGRGEQMFSMPSSSCFLRVLIINLFMAALSTASALDVRLSQVDTFALALGLELNEGTIEELKRYDLIVVDGEKASLSDVAALRADGTLVLGYVSVGTIERGRWWSSRARPYRMELWGDWGEWYAAVEKPGYQRLITRQVVPSMLAKGFDGLFLDNVDMVQSYPDRRRAMYALVREISRLAHQQNGLLFTQNGRAVTAPLSAVLDGWNREDVTLSYDFERRRYVRNSERQTRKALADLKVMRERGIFVSATDYIGTQDPALIQGAHDSACSAGAVSFVSNIDLSALPPSPYRCPVMWRRPE